MKPNLKFVATIYEKGKKSKIYHDTIEHSYKIIKDNEERKVEDRTTILIIKNIEKYRDNVNRKMKIANIKFGIRLSLFSFLIGISLYFGKNYIESKYADELIYIHSNKEKEDNFLLLHHCIEKNQTISLPFKEDLQKYIYLFAQYNSDMSIVKVATKIKSMDFSEEEQVTYSLLLKIFDFSNGDFIATQLYFTINDKYNGSGLNSYENLITNYLFFNEEAKEKILCGNDLKLEIDGKKYLVVLDNNNSYPPEVYDYLLRYQEEKLNEMHLPKDYVLNSTIFSSIVKAYSINRHISFYYKKEKSGKLVECTDEIYINKLSQFLIERDAPFDYYNKYDRILLYFYLDAIKRTNGYASIKDLSSFIYNTIKKDDLIFSGWISSFSYSDLINFLEYDFFSYNQLCEMWDFAFYSDAIGILQEFNLCLKIEVVEGNITPEEYDYFIEKVKFILENSPELFEKFKEANVLNRSIDGFRLELVPENKL